MWREWEEPPRYVACYFVEERWQVQAGHLVVSHQDTEFQLRLWLFCHGYAQVATNLYERKQYA